MDLDGVRLLIRVVEFGSVQRTAQMIGMSRSSLRRRLDNLESSIGKELIVYHATGVSLTPAGMIVLAEGRGLLESYGRMVSAAKSTSGEPQGRVVIVQPTGFPMAGRIAMLRQLSAMAPGVSIVSVDRMNPLDHVHEPFDLMFHFDERPSGGEWFSRLIDRIPLVPIASEAYLAEHGRPATVADLANHRLLGWHAGRTSPYEWPLRAGGSLRVEPIVCSHDGHLLHGAAQDGVGILLGDRRPAMHPYATPLVPVLESEIGRDLMLRCLSPLPSASDPPGKAIVAIVQGFLAAISVDA